MVVRLNAAGSAERESLPEVSTCPIWVGQTTIWQSGDQVKRPFWQGKKAVALLASALLAMSAGSPAGGASSAPAAPGNLAAIALSTNQVGLTWDDNSSNELWFYLDRSTNGFANINQLVLSSNLTLYVDTNLASGVTYAYRVRAWNKRGYSAYSNTNSATTFAPPVVSRQPQSQSAVAGTTVSFSVTAAGTPAPSYQWQFHGADLPGATSTTLTLAGIQPSNAGNYAAVVANSVGSVTSAVAVLTVLVPPAITTQPQSLTNAAGTIASFSAFATGTPPLIYQWQLNGLNLANNGRISGATNNALTIASVQAADVGSYTLVVSNTAGAVTSVVATLTVSGPPVITLQPVSQSVAG